MHTLDEIENKRRTGQANIALAGATTRAPKPCEAKRSGWEKVAAGRQGNGTPSRRRAPKGRFRRTANGLERMATTSGHLLRVGIGRCAKDVGPQIVTRHLATSCHLNGNAVFRRHRTAAINPLPDHLLAYLDAPCQLRLGAARFDCFLDEGCGHVLTIASLSIARNSIWPRA